MVPTRVKLGKKNPTDATSSPHPLPPAGSALIGQLSFTIMRNPFASYLFDPFRWSHVSLFLSSDLLMMEHISSSCLENGAWEVHLKRKKITLWKYLYSILTHEYNLCGWRILNGKRPSFGLLNTLLYCLPASNVALEKMPSWTFNPFFFVT